MRTVSLLFRRLHPNQFEEDQVWVEEDQSQPEHGFRLNIRVIMVRLIQWDSEVIFGCLPNLLF